MQSLVTMTVNPRTEIDVLLDVQASFYLPQKGKYTTFRSKHMDNIFFDTMIEVIFFMLSDAAIWHRKESQNIYNKLIGKLTLTQQAMFCSIGSDRKDRRYRLKTYNDCVIGTDFCKW